MTLQTVGATGKLKIANPVVLPPQFRVHVSGRECRAASSRGMSIVRSSATMAYGSVTGVGVPESTVKTAVTVVPPLLSTVTFLTMATLDEVQKVEESGVICKSSTR